MRRKGWTCIAKRGSKRVAVMTAQSVDDNGPCWHKKACTQRKEVNAKRVPPSPLEVQVDVACQKTLEAHVLPEMRKARELPDVREVPGFQSGELLPRGR